MMVNSSRWGLQSRYLTVRGPVLFTHRGEGQGEGDDEGQGLHCSGIGMFYVYVCVCVGVYLVVNG